MRLIPAVLPLLLLSAPAAGQNAELRAFKRAFRPTRDVAEAAFARRAALNALAPFDSEEVAEELLDAHVQLEREAAEIEERRLSYLGRGRSDRRLQRREELDPLRSLEAALEERIAGLADAAARALLVERALEDDKLALTLRLALVGGGEGAPPVDVAALEKLLRKARGGDALVALEAARALGPAAAPLVPRSAQYLEHDDAPLRAAAVAALEATASPEALAHLLDHMATEPRARLREGLTAALQRLTGARVGASAEAWALWREAEGGPYLAGERPLGGHETVAETRAGLPDYHGLPIDGEALVFLFDSSLSMQRTLDKPSRRAAEGQPSRESRAKEELVRVLGLLPPTTRFEVLTFDTPVRPCFEGLVPADERHVERAQAWILEHQLAWGTALYDALEAALVLAGRGATDEYWVSAVDTLYVLTDGEPYVGNRPDDRPTILAAVRRWNLAGQVRVHVIGLGDEAPRKFLERLAEQNGGQVRVEVAE